MNVIDFTSTEVSPTDAFGMDMAETGIRLTAVQFKVTTSKQPVLEWRLAAACVIGLLSCDCADPDIPQPVSQAPHSLWRFVTPQHVEQLETTENLNDPAAMAFFVRRLPCSHL